MIFEICSYENLHTALAELCRFLEENGASEHGIFHSRLAATELVGNVFKHAKGTARLQGTISGDCIELSVYSSAPSMPPAAGVCSDVYSESGRGLFIVDSICLQRITTPERITVIIRK